MHKVHFWHALRSWHDDDGDSRDDISADPFQSDGQRAARAADRLIHTPQTAREQSRLIIRTLEVHDVLESADKTNLSHFLSEAPWREDAINRRRIRFMLQETKPHRRRRHDSLIVIDDTLCEHVGNLFDDVDRHDTHGDGTYPLAHNPVTSFYVSGPVRFRRALRLYRRYEELTQWEAHVAKHFPDLKIPTEHKARNRRHQQVDPVLLQDPEFRVRHEQFRTKIALAIELVEAAIRDKVPVGVVVFDACYLAEDLIQVLARRRED